VGRGKKDETVDGGIAAHLISLPKNPPKLGQFTGGGGGGRERVIFLGV
jgi:hypothetical protein